MQIHEEMRHGNIESFLIEGAPSWEDIRTGTVQPTASSARPDGRLGGPFPLTSTESARTATAQGETLADPAPQPASTEMATTETPTCPTSPPAMAHPPAVQSPRPVPAALTQTSIATLREYRRALQDSFRLNAENGALTNRVLPYAPSLMAIPFLCPLQICPGCGEWSAKADIDFPRCDGMRCRRCHAHYCHFCGEHWSVADYRSDGHGSHYTTNGTRRQRVRDGWCRSRPGTNGHSGPGGTVNPAPSDSQAIAISHIIHAHQGWASVCRAIATSQEPTATHA